MFRAFTGCDTVSCFGGREKKTAWVTWTTYENIKPAFIALGNTSDLSAIYEWIQQVERFVVLLYDRTSTEEGMNRARKQLLSKKGRAIVGLAPTLAALIEHTKRAAYQAGHCWRHMMTPAPKLLSLNDWEWKKKASGGWDLIWTTLPEAPTGMQETLALWLQDRLQTWTLQMS